MSNSSPKEKRAALEKLHVLLDVAGTAHTWEEVSRSLRRCPTTIINALVYRVERARAQAFEEGQLSEDRDPSSKHDSHAEKGEPGYVTPIPFNG